MNALRMLQLRCDFMGNVPVKQPEGLASKLPEEMLAFYRQANGGRGWLHRENGEDEPDLILYESGELDEKRKEFLDQVRECYECWVLLAARELDAAEEERLRRLGEALTVLGECGDPEAPDYLCRKYGTYFLAEYGELEDLMKECPQKDALEEKNYTEFLDKILRAMELSELAWLEPETDREERN